MRLASLITAEAQEAAAMEADFLRSLHQTRQLEAELHDALAVVLQVRVGAWVGGLGRRVPPKGSCRCRPSTHAHSCALTSPGWNVS